MDEFQAAVIIAQAASAGQATYRFVSQSTMRFNFTSDREVQLFLNGISQYQRLQAVVEGTEVLLTYVD